MTADQALPISLESGHAAQHAEFRKSYQRTGDGQLRFKVVENGFVEGKAAKAGTYYERWECLECGEEVRHAGRIRTIETRPLASLTSDTAQRKIIGGGITEWDNPGKPGDKKNSAHLQSVRHCRAAENRRQSAASVSSRDAAQADQAVALPRKRRRGDMTTAIAAASTSNHTQETLGVPAQASALPPLAVGSDTREASVAAEVRQNDASYA